jgi:hypothetical protein
VTPAGFEPGKYAWSKAMCVEPDFTTGLQEINSTHGRIMNTYETNPQDTILVNLLELSV